jgi:hypothetical protein
MRKKRWVKTVPYTRLFNEMLLYSTDILRENKITHYPRIKINYHKHKRFYGYYRSSEIVIYVKNSDSIDELANVFCHELKHFLQENSDPEHFKKHNRSYNYNRFAWFLNYYCNEIEVDARMWADEHESKCLEFLQKKGIIVLK